MTDPVEAVPVDQHMLKPDVEKHLRQAHSLYPRHSKETKAEMITRHDRHHEQADDPDTGITLTIDHKHVYPETSEEDKGLLNKIRGNGRITEHPLSANERKALRELVDNDFRALEQDMRQFSADAWKAKKAEIEAEWSDRVNAGPRYEERARNLLHTIENDIKRLQEEAKAAGVNLNIPTQYSRSTPSSSIEGMHSAIKKAKEEHEQDLRRALLSLERERLRAQRRVLLSGVTTEAAKLLDDIPSAQKMMLEAARKESKPITNSKESV